MFLLSHTVCYLVKKGQLSYGVYCLNRIDHIFLFLRDEQDVVFVTDVLGDVADADALEIVAKLVVPVSVTRRVGIHRQSVLASL